MSILFTKYFKKNRYFYLHKNYSFFLKRNDYIFLSYFYWLFNIEHSQNAEGFCFRNKKTARLMSNFILKFEYDTIAIYQCFFYISPFIYFLKKKSFFKKKKIFFI